MDEKKNQLNEASGEFSFFSCDDRLVGLECGQCGKVFSFKRGLFVSVSKEGCVPNTSIICPDCAKNGRVVKAEAGTLIAAKRKGVAGSAVEIDSSLSSSDTAGSAGCICLLVSPVAFIIGLVCVIVYSAYSVGLVFMLISLACWVVGFICMLISNASETPEEKERSKAQMEAMVNRDKYNDLKYTCPMCGSHRIKNIGTAKKLGGVVMVGLASKNIGKNYQCDDCDYRW